MIFSLAFYFEPLIETVFGQQIYNITTQPTYVLMYFISMLFFYKNRDRLAPFIRNGGLIWVIVFLPIISTLWSDYPVVTLRRSFALVNNGLFGIYLGARYSLKEVMYFLRYIFIFIVVLSLICAVVFPTVGLMGNPHPGALRGVFTHKNSAGVRLALAAVVFLISYLDRLGSSQVVNVICFVLSCGMIVASQSTTGVGALLLSFIVLPFLSIPRGRLSQMLPAIFGLLFVAFVSLLLLVNNADTVLAAFGESSELTGRATFWPVVIDGIFQRFWIGYGYQAFWAGGLDGPAAILTHLATVNTKFHAHNGFLEMMLGVGFLGMVAFLLNLWTTVLNLLIGLRDSRGFITFFPILFLVQFFAMNMVETSMYSFNNISWVLYIYLIALAAKWDMQRRAQSQLQRVPSV
ncbi:MAG: O-antigen ligase family protein [Synechococcus sp.]